jgi:signal transduction histidine kinase
VRFQPLSFRARLALRWTIAFGLLLAAADLVIYAGVRTYVHRALDSQVRTLALTEAASAVDGPVGVHLHDVPQVAAAPAEFAEKLVQLYDADGRLLQHSAALAGAPPLLDADVAAAAAAGSTGLRSVAVLGRPATIVALPLERDGRRYTMIAGLFTDGIDAALERLSALLLTVWVAAILVTGALGHVLTSAALRRVEQITRRAALIARGDFAARLDPPVIQDELGRMTTSLNEVLDRLHGAVEANRRFAADASHELRGPITSMLGEIDVALTRERSPAEYRETLAAVRESLETLTAVAEDLMVLTRAQDMRKEIVLREVPLDRLVGDAVRAVAPVAGPRNIRVHADGLEGLVACAEPRLLARVVGNVIENAVRYNRDGGDVVIAGSCQEPAPGAWQTGTVTILCRDTGVGIPDAERERVFERFYRVDSSRARHTGGTGLGLAICREVLGVLGGSIRIAASSPEGTAIEVRIPGYRANSQAGGLRAS